MNKSSKIGRNDPCWCGSGKKYKKCHFGRSDDTPPESHKTATVSKGTVTPIRPVPDHIVAPPYVKAGKPVGRRTASVLTEEQELADMRHACLTARRTLDAIIEKAGVGVTTEELDAFAHTFIIEQGAYPSTVNYQGYTKAICTSVNEVVCHGIPDSRPLEDGDIVNIDVTVYINGFHGDCSETIFIGTPSDRAINLVKTTHASMMAGIHSVKPGVKVGEIGKAIEKVIRPTSYSIVRDFTGHGIGRKFHMDPSVLHFYTPSSRMRLKEGMTFTIEPMINEGEWGCRVWSDDWTAVTVDHKLSAQFEHTIIVTEDGAEILTTYPGYVPFFQKQLAAMGKA